MHRAWTGVGATSLRATGKGHDNSKSRSKFGISRGAHSSGFTNTRNQTSTFASDNQDGLTSSNVSHVQTLGGGVSGNRFSNRHAMGGTALEDTNEEWEMEMRKGDDAEVTLESPTASGSGGMRSEEHLGSEGSLNRPSDMGKAI